MSGKTPAPRSTDVALNLDADASAEFRRVTIDPSAGLPQDSAEIPNIAALLRGRSHTAAREILQNRFDDSAFRA